MVFVNDLLMILFRRNVCKVDDSAKISHRKLEESGAFSISVAFLHCASLRNTIAAPSTCGQWLKPQTSLEEAVWCRYKYVILVLVKWLQMLSFSELSSQDCSLVFQAENSCKISSHVDLGTECLCCLMSTLCL
jgi:hypothetical protein